MRLFLAARIGVALAAALEAGRPLPAQEPRDSTRPPPYSQLRIRLSGARNVNREALHEFWRAGSGGALGIATPFYVGSVGFGAAVVPFHARESTRPNFRALLVGLDWGLDLPVPAPLRAGVAARLGDFIMLVENPDLWLDSESELFVGGELAVGVPLRRDLALIVAGSAARVHTRPALDLALVAVGLEYATRTPRWLRTILE